MPNIIRDIILMVKKMNKKIIYTMFICIFIDQLIKIIVSNIALLNTPYEVIKNFFYLTHVRNLGAAWGIFYGNRYFLILVSLFALFIFYFVFIRNKKLSKFESISFGILLGGIIGNLIDRIVYGYVIDYLDFQIFNYDFPIFNFADTCIVISIILIIIKIIKDDSDGKIYNK